MINTIIWQLIVYWFLKSWLVEQLIFLKYHPVILHYVNIWIYFALGYIFVLSFINTNFPGGSDGKAFACNSGDWVQSLGQEDPLEKEMATHSSTLAWKMHAMDRGAW